MQWNYILKTFKFTIISQFILNYHQYNIFLERPRSPWEVHSEPLGLRGAQVGNLWLRGTVEFTNRNLAQLMKRKTEGAFTLFPRSRFNARNKGAISSICSNWRLTCNVMAAMLLLYTDLVKRCLIKALWNSARQACFGVNRIVRC